MASRWLSVMLAGALAIGAGAAWMVSDFRSHPAGDRTCLPNTAYAVDVQEDQATFDLPLEPGTRYRVILGSLGGSDQESTLTLSAEAVSEVERFPLRQILPLKSVNPHKLNTTWKPQPVSESETRPVLSKSIAQRTFFLHVTDGPLNDARQYAKVQSRLAAEGQFVRVYLDSQLAPRQLARGLVAEIVRLFDSKIVPQSRPILGEFRDVDGDGKFAILISPWLGKLQGGKTSLGGFVRGSDFQKHVKAPFGNQSDVLYLNANLQPGPHLHTLLAHEFAHAICFSERLPTKLAPNGLPAEEDWLNEAIAHLAENLHQTGWTNLDHRVSQFLDAPENSPLVVQNYYADGLWRDPGCRGATYLFLRWVVDQFGPEVLSRLIHAPERGSRNLETATGVPFPELFRRWTIALAQSGWENSAETANRAGQLTPLNLHQRIGRWSLIGTKATAWNPQVPQTFSLKGTTAKVFEIQTHAPGVYRLKVRSQGEPKLQVTVVRLSENDPQISAQANWETTESQLPLLRAQIQSPRESNLKVVRVSVECRQEAHRQSCCFEVNQIQFSQVSSQKNQTRVETLLTLPGRIFPRRADSTSDWQLKILAQDAQGRLVSRWIPLPIPPQPIPRRLAANPDHRVL